MYAFTTWACSIAVRIREIQKRYGKAPPEKGTYGTVVNGRQNDEHSKAIRTLSR